MQRHWKDAMMRGVEIKQMTSWMPVYEVWKLCCGYCPEKKLFLSALLLKKIKNYSNEIKSRMLYRFIIFMP